MQSPALYPLVAPGGLPRWPQRCSLTVADRSWPPDPVLVCPTPNHLARSALFPYACEVSCRVRAERVKPYASSLFLAGDSPRGSSENRAGPPPPGATRELGILAMQLSPIDIRLVGRLVKSAATSFMHPSAWKGFSPTSICRMPHSPARWPPMVCLRVLGSSRSTTICCTCA